MKTSSDKLRSVARANRVALGRIVPLAEQALNT